MKMAVQTLFFALGGLGYVAITGADPDFAIGSVFGWIACLIIVKPRKVTLEASKGSHE